MDNDPMSRHILYIYSLNDIFQLVNKPIRSNNILNLLFVKESYNFVTCAIMPELIASGHEYIQITFSYNKCN